MINNAYTRLHEVLLTEARGERQPQRDPNPLGGRGIPRAEFGTPSKLEKRLGVYLPTKGTTSALKQGRRGVTQDAGAGVAGTQTRTRHGREEPDGGSGFTRIRPEDKPHHANRGEPFLPHVANTAAKRYRKGQSGGSMGGGVRRLRRMIASKFFTAGETDSMRRKLKRKQIAGVERGLARGQRESVQATLPFPETKKKPTQTQRVQDSIRRLSKTGKLHSFFRKTLSTKEPLRTEK